MKNLKNVSMVLMAGVLVSLSTATFAGDQALHAALKAQQGKRATVVLTSGTELTGKVSELTQDSVKLAELSGKEFFDAVVDLDQVQAVVFRAREQ
jgi:hypothetical protein